MLLSVDYLLVLLALCAGVGGLYIGTRHLRRELSELRYAVADLEGRLLTEVKRRAAAARWDVEPSTGELKDELESKVKGFMTPLQFAARKRARRAGGTQDRQDAQEVR